jgi:copper homeostasis protein
VAKRIVLEMCIDSVESAIGAQAGGADRVELCDNLLEGGTTPSAGTIALARKHIDIALNVIIRPRGGDFCYSDVEFEVMKYDTETAKRLGANGVVIGLLKPDGSADVERTGVLVQLARPLSVTFHRAFDVCRDPFEGLDDLMQLGIDRVLTSGQEPSVMEGLDLISELVRKAGDRIIIMPGAGITERNVAKVVAVTGAREVHVLSAASVDSPMQHRNLRVFMGGELRPPEFTRMVTSADRVRAIRQAIR